MCEGKFVGQEIEAGAQIEQAIPDEDRKGGWVGGHDFIDVDDVFAALALEVMDESITVSLSPARDLMFEFLQVVKRPHEG